MGQIARLKWQTLAIMALSLSVLSGCTSRKQIAYDSRVETRRVDDQFLPHFKLQHTEGEFSFRIEQEVAYYSEKIQHEETTYEVTKYVVKGDKVVSLIFYGAMTFGLGWFAFLEPSVYSSVDSVETVNEYNRKLISRERRSEWQSFTGTVRIKPVSLDGKPQVLTPNRGIYHFGPIEAMAILGTMPKSTAQFRIERPSGDSRQFVGNIEFGLDVLRPYDPGSD